LRGFEASRSSREELLFYLEGGAMETPLQELLVDHHLLPLSLFLDCRSLIQHKLA